ncbi:MAG: GTPase, partial [Dolichospermum sp.]
EKLEKLRRGRDVYVVGCTNVGKSTLINRLLFKTKGPKHRLLTTSSIPGTTLNLISFPIGARRKHRPQAHLYDTPGIVNEYQMARILTPEELKVTGSELDAAYQQVSKDLLRSIRLACQKIETFHRQRVPKSWVQLGDDEVVLGKRYTPVD